MTRKHSCLLLLTVLASTLGAGLPMRGAAQAAQSTVSIGERATVWSDTLQEKRRILIHLPVDYYRSTQRYPVVYILDGEWLFLPAVSATEFLTSAPGNGRIPDTIVIGIPDTQRNRDLTPATSSADLLKAHPGAGGADAFLKFLGDELTPWVDARYRTQPYRILIGHSLGGLFAVHALLSRPDAFQAYIAISPSLWWDNQATLHRAIQEIGKTPPGHHYLRVSWTDDEPPIRDSTHLLIEALRTSPPANLLWAQRYYPGDDHNSSPYRSLYDGLQDLFAGWRLPPRINGVMQEYDLKTVQAHYAALSRMYGFEVKPTSWAIDDVAQTLLKHGDKEAALALVRRNVRDYPWQPFVHEALGRTLEKLNRPEEALLAYQEARRLSVEDELSYVDPLETYRAHEKDLAGERPSGTDAH